MLTPVQLAEAFARNANIIQRQSAGLTTEDSLLQPPFQANCLNWVLGHLANNRDIILGLMGCEPVLGEIAARYRRESEPVTGPADDILPLEQLVASFEASQAAMANWLAAATPEDLAKEVPFAGRTGPLASRLFFLYFHETYHVGQTELLRQLAGKNDHII